MDDAAIVIAPAAATPPLPLLPTMTPTAGGGGGSVNSVGLKKKSPLKRKVEWQISNPKVK